MHRKPEDKASLVTSGAITNHIDRMEAKGLVEWVRDRDDRRSVHIRLTPHGQAVLDWIFSLYMVSGERMLVVLHPLDWILFDLLISTCAT